MTKLPAVWMWMLVMGLALLAGCSQGPSTSDRDLVQISETELMDMLTQQGEGTVLLDPRSAHRFEAGHLPGAINIPLPQIVASHPQLATAQRIVVYGSGWQDHISSAAAKRLVALGYRHVYDFRGGVELWQRSGYRIESSQ